MTLSEERGAFRAGGLERLGRDGVARVLAKARAEGVDSAMREALARDVDLVPFLRITGRADWRFFLPDHGHQCAVVLGSGLGGTAFDLSEAYGDVVSCERSPEALEWQGHVASARSFANVRIVPGLSERAPLADGCADLVALEGGVAESGAAARDEEPKDVAGRAVREARRLLKDGGWLYWGLENRLGWPLSRRRRDEVGFDLAPGDIRNLLAREGLCDVALYWVRRDLLTQLNSGWLWDSRMFGEFVRTRETQGASEALQTVGLKLLQWTTAYRRIVPHILVLARKSASERTMAPRRHAAPPQPAFVRDVERLLADQGRPAEDLRAMLASANYNTRGRLTYRLFRRSGSRPSHVVKLARTRVSREAVAAEARAFQTLITRSEFVRRQRPRLYHLGEGSTFVLEEFVAGRTLSALQGRPEYEARALDWLRGFQSAAAGGPLRRVDLGERLRRLAVATESEPLRMLADDTARRVMAAEDFEVAEVPVHGDFTASNILLDGNDLYVIDWEWLRLGGWPLEDLWWFLIASARDAPRAALGSGAERVLDTLTGRGDHASRVRDVARGFAIGRGAPPRLVPVFAIVTLLEMGARWKDEKRIDWLTSPMAEYEAALRGLLLRQNEFWEFWGNGDDTDDRAR